MSVFEGIPHRVGAFFTFRPEGDKASAGPSGIFEFSLRRLAFIYPRSLAFPCSQGSPPPLQASRVLFTYFSPFLIREAQVPKQLVKFLDVTMFFAGAYL